MPAGTGDLLGRRRLATTDHHHQAANHDYQAANHDFNGRLDHHQAHDHPPYDNNVCVHLKHQAADDVVHHHHREADNDNNRCW